MSWIEEGVELSSLENSQYKTVCSPKHVGEIKKLTLIIIKNGKLDRFKPVSNIIQKELNFWENEKTHNATKHTCCVFDE